MNCDTAWQDCSAATENILLAAHALGLGIHPRRERIEGIIKLLALPGNIRPLSLIALGYPAEEKPPSERFDTKRIHYDGWVRKK